MSEQNITIVRDNSSSEVKVFIGSELRGRYKDDATALAHLATALVDLTAARKRIAELEQMCTLDGIEDLIRMRDAITSENERLRELLRDACRSFECYAAHDKPESQWDEYDHMMNPIWKRIKAAIGEGE